MTQPLYDTNALVRAALACRNVQEALSGPLDVAQWLLDGLAIARTVLDDQVRATDRPAPLTRNEIDQTIRNMRVYGGGFVGALAEAWSRADSINSAIIEQAFPPLIRRYGPGSDYWKAAGPAPSADALKTRMFTVGDGPLVSLAEFLRVNAHAPEVCAWARDAYLNETTNEFGVQTCRRVA